MLQQTVFAMISTGSYCRPAACLSTSRRLPSFSDTPLSESPNGGDLGVCWLVTGKEKWKSWLNGHAEMGPRCAGRASYCASARRPILVTRSGGSGGWTQIGARSIAMIGAFTLNVARFFRIFRLLKWRPSKLDGDTRRLAILQRPG